jgi:hypothetical protein
MRNFDLAPLYRATVGFDQIADMMDRVLSAEMNQPTYPPYNIEKPPMMPIASPSRSQAFQPMIWPWM